jgi:adenosylmethionine-8-amino-7-oxononanoate aminotransferase
VVNYSFANGLIVYASKGAINGALGDAILVTPPLVINEEEMKELVGILDKVIGEVEGELL